MALVQNGVGSHQPQPGLSGSAFQVSRLPRILPAASPVVLLFGRRPELFEHQDPMLPPSELFVHEDLGGVLCFRSENQGCAV
ncbi:hypothetical protein V7793_06190 [Streptomyces sp. KLMMK]|uniref:hypothetical protein n=1 Tax=Streptomyces sp. KLMMK TaxID=3109353 RepID=UPI002FFDB822